uniref:Uncharacterized protein n=2 Tax=Aegilops tauschii subsp. strangulata TaxID=200361 RepID=A0A453HJQ7_AEGTS
IPISKEKKKTLATGEAFFWKPPCHCRRARGRPPMAPPFVYARSSGDGTAHDAALRAAFYGDLRRLRGSCKVTEFLLSKGVPVDIHYGYGTPLHLAATNEQDKIVKILLEHHADANTSVTSLGSALMGALLCRSLKCMKLLIKGGADVNRMTSLLMTPLVFTAGRKDYTNFMQFLLKAGADPNIPDGVCFPYFLDLLY